MEKGRQRVDRSVLLLSRELLYPVSLRYATQTQENAPDKITDDETEEK
jgi:hypothetical protein